MLPTNQPTIWTNWEVEYLNFISPIIIYIRVTINKIIPNYDDVLNTEEKDITTKFLHYFNHICSQDRWNRIQIPIIVIQHHNRLPLSYDTVGYEE